MFTDFFLGVFKTLLTFDWFSFFGGAKEVVDIIWKSLSENYGPLLEQFQKNKTEE